MQSFAERIFSREISPRHGGINNHHCRGFFRIGGGEKAALHERYSESFEIIWSDGAVAGNDVVVRRFWRTSTDVEMQRTAATADRQKGCGASRAHTGEGLGAFDEAIKEFKSLLRFRIGGQRKRKIRDQEMVGLKTGRHFLQSRKTAQQKAGADEQEHGRGNLRRDKHTTNAMLTGSRGGAARTFSQRFAKIQLGGSNGGHDAEDKSRHK